MSKHPEEESSILMPLLIALLAVVGIVTVALFAYMGFNFAKTNREIEALSQENNTSSQNQAGSQTQAPSQSQSEQQPNPQEPAQPDKSSTPTQPTQIGEHSGNLGDYYVEIKGAALAKDTDGNPAIIVTYDWTNNSDETKSEAAALYGKAFQDGVQLEPAFILDSDAYAEAGNSMKEIRPGSSLTIQAAFVMTSETSVVEFEISELISLSNDIVSMDFDPTSL